jgi:uncharacterized protein YecT (DUF1311 family)
MTSCKQSASAIWILLGSLTVCSGCSGSTPRGVDCPRPLMGGGGTAGTPAPAKDRDEHLAVDPCGSETTTLGMEACAGEEMRRLEARITAIMEDLAALLRDHGAPDSPSTLAVSEKQWEQYRDTQCHLHEQLAQGGSLAGLNVVICRRSLAASRLEHLSALKESIVQ